MKFPFAIIVRLAGLAIALIALECRADDNLAGLHRRR